MPLSMNTRAILGKAKVTRNRNTKSPMVPRNVSQSQTVVIAPACVWDSGRDLLAPYLDSLARRQARLLFVGQPKDPDLGQAQNYGVGGLLSGILDF